MRYQQAAISIAAALLLTEINVALFAAPLPAATTLKVVHATASSAAADFPAKAAVDGDRFSLDSGRQWKASLPQENASWTADLGAVVEVGSVLQVLGGSETTLESPVSYQWEASEDGQTWRPATDRIDGDWRMYRILRFSNPVKARYIRITFYSVDRRAPALREIELYAERDAAIEFPEWIAAINSFEVASVDSCDQFAALVHKCKDWESAPAQYLWHGRLSNDFAEAEPQPACMFFTGSFADWCQVDPATWKAVAALVELGRMPIWASCGGAQALGILADSGDLPKWDCPKCRDPLHPKTPIYGHIGGVDARLKLQCGDYTNNLWERGPTMVRLARPDPAFEGLGEEFEVPEYHCGQLEYLPKGWDLIVTKARGGKTWMQCMKKRNTCIYAAQFHIEIEGTPESSLRIMTNFLNEARQWNRRLGAHAAVAEGAAP